MANTKERQTVTQIRNRFFCTTDHYEITSNSIDSPCYPQKLKCHLCFIQNNYIIFTDLLSEYMNILLCMHQHVSPLPP